MTPEVTAAIARLEERTSMPMAKSIGSIPVSCADIAALISAYREAERALNTPELHDFANGVALEATHQRERWGSDHDAGKAAEDWFWLVGYLAGKALHSHKLRDTDKALHHTITTAAALANWHAAIDGTHTRMRPGIDAAIAKGGSK